MSKPRRRRGGKLLTLGLLGALGAAAYWFLQFSGIDIGIPSLNPTEAERAESQPPADAAAEAAPPCELRVDPAGVHLEGRQVGVAEAIDACRPASEAVLIVTGDARYGTFERIRDALEQAGISVRVVR